MGLIPTRMTLQRIIFMSPLWYVSRVPPVNTQCFDLLDATVCLNTRFPLAFPLYAGYRGVLAKNYITLIYFFCKYIGLSNILATKKNSTTFMIPKNQNINFNSCNLTLLLFSFKTKTRVTNHKTVTHPHTT